MSKKTSRTKTTYRYPNKLRRGALKDVNSKIILKISTGNYVKVEDQYFRVARTPKCSNICCKYRKLLVLQSLSNKREYYMNICPSVYAILKVYKTKLQMATDLL